MRLTMVALWFISIAAAQVTMPEKARYLQRDLIDKHLVDGLYVSIVPAGSPVEHTVDEPIRVPVDGITSDGTPYNGTVYVPDIDTASGYNFAHKIFGSTFGGSYAFPDRVLWWVGVTLIATWVLSFTRFGKSPSGISLA